MIQHKLLRTYADKNVALAILMAMWRFATHAYNTKYNKSAELSPQCRAAAI